MSDNPNFVPTLSSDEIWRDQDTNRCLSDDLDAIDADIASLKATAGTHALVNHAHTEYATSDDITALQDAVSSKADANHVHNGYADLSHNHDDMYYKKPEIDSKLSGKANTNHTHDGYAIADHSHTEYATVTALNQVADEVDGKANSSHTHDNRYYTEAEIDSKLEDKANTNHTHVVDSSLSATSTNPVQNKVINAALSGKVPATRKVNGKALNADITLSASDVGADISGAAASAITSANAYTNQKIDALVGTGASTTLDTIGEISAAIEDNQDAIDILNSAIGTKANASDLTSHTSNTTVHITSVERTNWNTAKTHAGSAHAPSNAEENQNAFSNVVVGNTTIAADTKTDALTLVGSNVTLTPDSANDKVTIGITKSNVTSALGYTPPTTNTTYNVATQSANGLMSSSDKTKLDGVAAGANKYVLPSAGASLGGVKTGGDVTISNGTITVNDDSHNHTIANVDGLQSALDSKAASNHEHSGYAASNHNHDSDYAPIFTNNQGGVEYSYGSGSGKNVLTEISNMSQGFHTIYAIAGTAGNPRSNDSFRYFIHKTSGTIGWILAFDPQGSIYANYQSAANTFKGWRCIYEVSNKMILWSGASYLTSTDGTPQTVTPSKKLSECRTGWLLLWSDYDPGEGANDIDFATTMIPKYTPTGGKWGGKAFLCDIPAYVGGDPNDANTEKRIIKPIYVHDDCIKGSYQNTSGGRSDVCLRAVFEF